MRGPWCLTPLLSIAVSDRTHWILAVGGGRRRRRGGRVCLKAELIANHLSLVPGSHSHGNSLLGRYSAEIVAMVTTTQDWQFPGTQNPQDNPQKQVDTIALTYSQLVVKPGALHPQPRLSQLPDLLRLAHPPHPVVLPAWCFPHSSGPRSVRISFPRHLALGCWSASSSSWEQADVSLSE